MQEEWLSMEDLYSAYLDCMRRKRNTIAASIFEQNEASNLFHLWKDLNNQTYEIGYSNAFCVTRPKLREVFAADFRDRIVHHLLIMRLEELFEAEFIYNTFNCRKGKGTDAGVRTLYSITQRHPNGWCLCFDIKGFFMHIDKRILVEKLTGFIRERYLRRDKEQILWLTELIVMHCPEKRCRKKGDLTLWKGLERDKSLFTNGEGLGLAIGNLTSQIFANYYLSDFDHWASGFDGVEYVRYVDDGRMISDNKELLLELIPKIRTYLRRHLHLELHPNKISLQRVDKGFSFIGSHIKRGRIYINNRTVGNCEDTINLFCRKSEMSKEETIERFSQQINSYFGFMLHRKTYAIRYRLFKLLTPECFKFAYMSGRMRSLKVKKKYKTKTKLYKKYGHKIILRYKRLQRRHQQ